MDYCKQAKAIPIILSGHRSILSLTALHDSSHSCSLELVLAYVMLCLFNTVCQVKFNYDMYCP